MFYYLFNFTVLVVSRICDVNQKVLIQQGDGCPFSLQGVSSLNLRKTNTSARLYVMQNLLCR